MLTADLVRVTRRSGSITPRYVRRNREQAETVAALLCEEYSGAAGKTRGELDERIRDLVGDSPDFILSRGLAKLLDDRSEWGNNLGLDPVDVRRAVFEEAAGRGPVVRDPRVADGVSRAEVIAAVARKLDASAQDIEILMQADLKRNHRLLSHRAIGAVDLVDRYNLALAQGVLLRATELRLNITEAQPKKLRAIFRAIKFHQLMHTATRIDDTWHIRLDGPASMFAQGQRYGLQMAMFLPAVLGLSQWAIEADIMWDRDGGTQVMKLDPRSPLKTTQKLRGTWVSEEEKLFVSRVNKHKLPWTAHKAGDVIDLGGVDVLVPDLCLRRDGDGAEVLLEIVGFWRKSWLERRLEALAQFGPDNVILCVSRRLSAERGALRAAGAAVIDFAQVISVPGVIELAERIAQPGGTTAATCLTGGIASPGRSG